jgi:hypothetical protein
MRLQPLEIFIMRRYVHDMPLDGFPGCDELASELQRQLTVLPQTNLIFARNVYGTFAQSPYPIDRLNVGLMFRSLTRVDHETGLALWSQLVRDGNPVVRRDVFEPMRSHVDSADGSVEEGRAQEGLTLADGNQLRDEFIRAHYLGGCHVVGHAAITDALREATHSVESFARI